MLSKEKTISSEMVYEGKILNLRKDKVEISGGKTSYREIVEHNGAVAIVAITDDEKVIVVNQFRKPAEDVIMEIPAGKIDPGEEPETAAHRELKEETGYRAADIRLLSSFYPSVGYSQEIIYVYLCTGLIAGDAQPDEGEELEMIADYTLDDLKEMIMAGQINDSKTIIGVMTAREFLATAR